jgi:hypothetical protein
MTSSGSSPATSSNSPRLRLPRLRYVQPKKEASHLQAERVCWEGDREEDSNILSLGLYPLNIGGPFLNKDTVSAIRAADTGVLIIDFHRPLATCTLVIHALYSTSSVAFLTYLETARPIVVDGR